MRERREAFFLHSFVAAFHLIARQAHDGAKVAFVEVGLDLDHLRPQGIPYP